MKTGVLLCIFVFVVFGLKQTKQYENYTQQQITIQEEVMFKIDLIV